MFCFVARRAGFGIPKTALERIQTEALLCFRSNLKNKTSKEENNSKERSRLTVSEEGDPPPETLNLSTEGRAIFGCGISLQTQAPWGWAGSYFSVSTLSQQIEAWLNRAETSPPAFHRNTSSVRPHSPSPHCCCLSHRIKQQVCVEWGHFRILLFGVLYDLHGSLLACARPVFILRHPLLQTAAQPASATPFPIN